MLLNYSIFDHFFCALLKYRAQGDQQGFLQGPSIQIVVRRSHLYEDAFDKLRPENGKRRDELDLFIFVFN